jgi:hypothetical protein
MAVYRLVLRSFASPILCLMLSAGSLSACRPGQDAARLPSDLLIQVTTGGLAPEDENRSLRITADGKGLYSRSVSGRIAPALEERAFTIDRSDLEAIWSTLARLRFFSLAPHQARGDVHDGGFVSVSVTARGRTHMVECENVPCAPLQDVLRSIRRVLPAGADLSYRAPGF